MIFFGLTLKALRFVFGFGSFGKIMTDFDFLDTFAVRKKNVGEEKSSGKSRCCPLHKPFRINLWLTIDTNALHILTTLSLFINPPVKLLFLAINIKS